MMNQAPFRALDFSVEAQQFLYACAFWTVAADEELKPSEQKWLTDQFGEAGATKSLDEFVGLESEGFFRAFDAAAVSVPNNEMRQIRPNLEKWLMTCCASDDMESENETRTIARIKERLARDKRTAMMFEGKGTARTILVGKAAVLSGSVGPDDEENKVFWSLSGHDGEITSVRFSPDGSRILSGSDDGTVRLWDTENRSELWSRPVSEMSVNCVAFSRSGSIAMAGDSLGKVHSFDTASGKEAWSVELTRQGGITDIDVSSDDKMLLTSSDVGSIAVFAIPGVRRLRVFSEKRWGSVLAAKFSPDGKLIASGGDDNILRIWDSSGNPVKELEGHDQGITSLRFSPDGRTLATAARDNTVRLWDARTFETVRVCVGHDFSVYGVCFSADGKYMASASWDHSVRVWETETGAEMLNINSFDERFSCASFHPDGSLLAAGGSENTVLVVRMNA